MANGDALRSETNALNPLEQTSDEARPADAPTLSATDACGHPLFERLGLGGMHLPATSLNSPSPIAHFF
jgi:hypothetical protein